jgi:hypothetical protein
VFLAQLHVRARLLNAVFQRAVGDVLLSRAPPAVASAAAFAADVFAPYGKTGAFCRSLKSLAAATGFITTAEVSFRSTSAASTTVTATTIKETVGGGGGGPPLFDARACGEPGGSYDAQRVLTCLFDDGPGPVEVRPSHPDARLR